MEQVEEIKFSYTKNSEFFVDLLQLIGVYVYTFVNQYFNKGTQINYNNLYISFLIFVLLTLMYDFFIIKSKLNCMNQNENKFTELLQLFGMLIGIVFLFKVRVSNYPNYFVAFKLTYVIYNTIKIALAARNKKYITDSLKILEPIIILNIVLLLITDPIVNSLPCEIDSDSNPIIKWNNLFNDHGYATCNIIEENGQFTKSDQSNFSFTSFFKYIFSFSGLIYDNNSNNKINQNIGTSNYSELFLLFNLKNLKNSNSVEYIACNNSDSNLINFFELLFRYLDFQFIIMAFYILNGEKVIKEEIDCKYLSMSSILGKYDSYIYFCYLLAAHYVFCILTVISSGLVYLLQLLSFLIGLHMVILYQKRKIDETKVWMFTYILICMALWVISVILIKLI